MTRRHPLTLAGGDVRLAVSLPDGRVRCVYIDRHGNDLPSTRDAWPHELRGIGWHLAAVKRAIAALAPAPSQARTGGSASSSEAREPESTQPRARPRAWLAAHHAADALTSRED